MSTVKLKYPALGPGLILNRDLPIILQVSDQDLSFKFKVERSKTSGSAS